MPSIKELVARFNAAMSELDNVQRLAMLAMAFQVRKLLPNDNAHPMGHGLYWIEDACLGRSDDMGHNITAPAFVYETANLSWGKDALDESAINAYLSAALQVSANYLMPLYTKLFVARRISLSEIEFLISKGVAIVNTHRKQFIRGIYYGAEGDFATAACLLAPQIENFVRVLYDVNDINVICQNSRPKGFGTLLDDPAGANIMSPIPAFEFRCIFADKRGLNLRNLLAHGNLNDDKLDGIETFYVWWLALRMAVNLKMVPKLKPRNRIVQ